MTIGNGSKLRNTSVGDKVRAAGLRFARGRMIVVLADDREVSIPLTWYPTLARASSAQRLRWKMLGRGEGFHWPGLDLDLSVAGLTNGFREAIPRPPGLQQRSSSGISRPRRRSA